MYIFIFYLLNTYEENSGRNIFLIYFIILNVLTITVESTFMCFVLEQINPYLKIKKKQKRYNDTK